MKKSELRQMIREELIILTEAKDRQLKIDFIGDGFVKDNIRIIWPELGKQHLNMNNMSAVNNLVSDIIERNIDVIWADKKMPNKILKRLQMVVDRAKNKGHSVVLKQ